MTSPTVGTDIDHAISILRNGGVVGLPTETVYGLGADASNADAVRRVFRIKGRPEDHPLIVHVADRAAARTWSSAWPEAAEILAAAFWPGPLTIIVPRSAAVIDAVTGGRSTVALRCPSHPVMHRLLEAFGGGIAAPSANRFGKVSPTTARHVLDDLGGEVDYVLDGGPCSVGVESTIVDCTVDPPQILRPGGVSDERIRAVLGAIAPASGPSRAPGMLESHYAPVCRVHPVADADDAESTAARLTADADGSAPEILDAASNPDEFATAMYGLLRDCDRRGVRDVVVILPPETGIGSAIRDRIFKAAAGSESS